MRRTSENQSEPQGFRRSVRQFEIMLRERKGLKDLLRLLPPGSTLDDARRAREAMIQRARTPCSFLDSDLGIVRGLGTSR